MGKWNHRIMVSEHEGEPYFQIHEVYYNEKGVPVSHTKEPIGVCGDSIEEILWVLEKMGECTKKPVLWLGDKFPQEYVIKNRDNIKKIKKPFTVFNGENVYSYDNRHLHRFFRLKTIPLLIQEQLFPNLKEITESMAAFVAIQDHLINKVIKNNNNVDVYVIGDGYTPRTGALIACLTKWNVISIDPKMKSVGWNINRLTTYRKRIDDLYFNNENENTVAVIIFVHSHASIKKSLEVICGYSKRHVIDIPCCFDADITKKPDVNYVDMGIQSEKQKVNIYLNV